MMSLVLAEEMAKETLGSGKKVAPQVDDLDVVVVDQGRARLASCP